MKIKDANNFKELKQSFEIDITKQVKSNFDNRITRDIEHELKKDNIDLNKQINVETIKTLIDHYDKISNQIILYKDYMIEMRNAHIKLLEQVERNYENEI